VGRDAQSGLRTSQQPRYLDLVQAEPANLRTALQRLIDTHRLGEAARLLSDTWLAWALRGSAGEGLEWVSRIRADSRSAALTPADRAHLELVTGGLRYATGDLAGTAAAAAEAVALARTADPAILPDAFLLLGSGQLFTGAGEAAVQTLGEAASLAAAADDAWSATHARIADGQRLLTLGRGGPAATVLAEAEAMARDLASPFTLSVALKRAGHPVAGVRRRRRCSRQVSGGDSTVGRGRDDVDVGVRPAWPGDDRRPTRSGRPRRAAVRGWVDDQ
jgi:hypothetical protein